MKRIPFEQGRMVRSLQGRDSGRCFVVLNVDGDFVLMADGGLRKTGRPKRKKMMHLHATPVLFPEISSKLRSGFPVADSELRKALMQAQQDLPTCKEGCGLVQE